MNHPHTPPDDPRIDFENHDDASDDGHLRYLLTAYLFENLSDEGVAEVETHLEECAECRAELDELRSTLALVHDALVPDALFEGDDEESGEGNTHAKPYSFEAHRLERVLAAGRQRHFDPNLRFWGKIAAGLLVLATGFAMTVPSLLSSRSGNSRIANWMETAAPGAEPRSSFEDDGRVGVEYSGTAGGFARERRPSGAPRSETGLENQRRSASNVDGTFAPTSDDAIEMTEFGAGSYGYRYGKASSAEGDGDDRGAGLEEMKGVAAGEPVNEVLADAPGHFSADLDGEAPAMGWSAGVAFDTTHSGGTDIGFNNVGPPTTQTLSSNQPSILGGQPTSVTTFHVVPRNPTPVDGYNLAIGYDSNSVTVDHLGGPGATHNWGLTQPQSGIYAIGGQGSAALQNPALPNPMDGFDPNPGGPAGGGGGGFPDPTLALSGNKNATGGYLGDVGVITVIPEFASNGAAPLGTPALDGNADAKSNESPKEIEGFDRFSFSDSTGSTSAFIDLPRQAPPTGSARDVPQTATATRTPPAARPGASPQYDPSKRRNIQLKPDVIRSPNLADMNLRKNAVEKSPFTPAPDPSAPAPEANAAVRDRIVSSAELKDKEVATGGRRAVREAPSRIAPRPDAIEAVELAWDDDADLIAGLPAGSEESLRRGETAADAGRFAETRAQFGRGTRWSDDRAGLDEHEKRVERTLEETAQRAQTAIEDLSREAQEQSAQIRTLRESTAADAYKREKLDEVTKKLGDELDRVQDLGEVTRRWKAAPEGEFAKRDGAFAGEQAEDEVDLPESIEFFGWYQPPADATNVRREAENAPAPATRGIAAERPGDASTGKTTISRVRRIELRAQQAAHERTLRAYQYYRALDPELDRARFLSDPLPIPAPEVGDEGLGREGFRDRFGVNPFVETARDAQSTFAMDVDTASYTRALSVIAGGGLPDPSAVRTEEFVNAFPDPRPASPDRAFSVFVEGGPAPFAGPSASTGTAALETSNVGVEQLQITVKARELAAAERRPVNLTFAIDTSGSMDIDARLAVVRTALETLLANLTPEDRVGIVAYGTQAYLVLPHTSARERGRILDALGSLTALGSTNVEAGLGLAYRLADEIAHPRAVNRVVLCSDGVATSGARSADEILETVRAYADRGIDLSVVGFGKERYDDAFLEQLANRGNGNYAYVDTPQDAIRVFQTNLPAALSVLARDAKIQVEFDPAVVSRYRLLGYENRDVADADFRNDAIDAGEVGPGSTVTAIYEVVRRPASSGDLGRVFLRYHDTTLGRVDELDFPIPPGVVATALEATTDRFKLLAAVAECAEVLRGSYFARDGALSAVLALTDELTPAARANDDVRTFIETTERALEVSVERWSQ